MDFKFHHFSGGGWGELKLEQLFQRKNRTWFKTQTKPFQSILIDLYFLSFLFIAPTYHPTIPRGQSWHKPTLQNTAALIGATIAAYINCHPGILLEAIIHNGYLQSVLDIITSKIFDGSPPDTKLRKLLVSSCEEGKSEELV